MLRLLSSKYAKIFEKHLKPVMMVFIGNLSEESNLDSQTVQRRVVGFDPMKIFHSHVFQNMALSESYHHNCPDFLKVLKQGLSLDQSNPLSGHG